MTLSRVFVESGWKVSAIGLAQAHRGEAEVKSLDRPAMLLL